MPQSYEHHGRTYSGKTSDVLVVISEAAKEMTEHALREVEIYLPFGDGDATIRMKR